VHFHPNNVTPVEVAVFLRAVLRHLRHHVIVVWDSGTIHKGPDVRALLERYPPRHRGVFPGYAPELNPDEFVWTHFKAALANGQPDTQAQLLMTLCRLTAKVRRRPALIRSFVAAADLPAFL